ncbi:peptidyl-prolyl cis-trans isomerase [Streptomyces coeruleorubidus]|uniref:peptidyl-prolyl cis-trans isomerase n=1 Tax=Streptomyces coeruleorubidus TaxID=116188 RepID=UPI00237F8B17|nr:peptidyl-prolyl cis-trans isomerase [Streptomyces coeruleorubidus]WDV55220.1 peptidyl-prolyl cis-trans isomerase [Streptomyces coeruleorubidus]
MTEEYAATVHGDPIPKQHVEAFLSASAFRSAGNCASNHNTAAHARQHTAALSARAERQRRRWATQVIVTDELARRACAERGLDPPRDVLPMHLLTVPESDVADLGSIVAAALAHSPAARALVADLEREQHIPETAVRDYYDRNRDRFLTPDALRRGVDPYDEPTPSDIQPYEHVRNAITRELRHAAARRAFFAWLDRARADVVYAEGHEHPGDPSHPDHEHRH